jgi:hypothetical protein
MSYSHWENYHRLWDRLGPPLRPHQDVVVAFERLLAGHAKHVLLLGVTREFAGLGERLTAIDHNAQMIANLWPGDTEIRHAEKGDWLALPFPARHFSAAIGDGALVMLAYPTAYTTLFEQLGRVLEPEGLFATRFFATPDGNRDTMPTLREQVLARGAGSFNAFKWRLAMVLVTQARNPNIKVTAIRDAFEQMFPDREVLAAATGWELEDIATIDAYKDSRTIYSFPTREELRAVIPGDFVNARFISSGAYDLAERCPIVVMERRR